MDEIINYVINTPGNTNPNVLKGILDELAPEPSGTIEIVQNGLVDVSEYAEASVNIPLPSGTINITENGTVNVSEYAEASVGIPLTEYELIPLNITRQASNPCTFSYSYFFENGKLITKHYGSDGGVQNCYLPYYIDPTSMSTPILSYIARIIVQYTNKTIVVTGGENTQVTILTQYYNAPNQEAIVRIYQTDFSVDPSITISLTD